MCEMRSRRNGVAPSTYTRDYAMTRCRLALWSSLVGSAVLAWTMGGHTVNARSFDNDPNLPNVLIIGDSISVGYTELVARLLAGKANVHHPPENCQSTVYALAHIKEWLGTEHWDVVHFNWGIWDMHHLDGERIAVGGRIRTTPEQYRKNLRMLVGILKSSGAKLIWATTTPAAQPRDSSLPLNAIDEEDVPIYNRVARKVMRAEKIQIDDLYRAALPKVDRYRIADNIHYSSEGSEFLAEQVAESIQVALRPVHAKDRMRKSR